MIKKFFPLVFVVLAACAKFSPNSSAAGGGTAGTPSPAEITAPSIVLNWNAPDQGQDGFFVETSPDNVNLTQVAQVVGKTANSYVLADANPGQTTYVRIRAYNAVGSSGYSTTIALAPTIRGRRGASWACPGTTSTARAVSSSAAVRTTLVVRPPRLRPRPRAAADRAGPSCFCGGAPRPRVGGPGRRCRRRTPAGRPRTAGRRSGPRTAGGARRTPPTGGAGCAPRPTPRTRPAGPATGSPPGRRTAGPRGTPGRGRPAGARPGVAWPAGPAAPSPPRGRP